MKIEVYNHRAEPFIAEKVNVKGRAWFVYREGEDRLKSIMVILEEHTFTCLWDDNLKFYFDPEINLTELGCLP